MEYFKVLKLRKEPFSNSAETDFFYSSTMHKECMRKLDESVRNKRGLNVVIGDVGTGKTTLCRKFIASLSAGDDESVETHLILDLSFDSPVDFLRLVANRLGAADADTERQLKENINYTLLQKDKEGKTVVLIIDEGQRLPDFSIELLREFFNYETIDHKLLQIVVFAQKEFLPLMKNHANFVDRINVRYFLTPLSLADTKRMIKFRISRASGTDKPPVLFTAAGLLAVHLATGGYPRKIVTLCHNVVLAMILRNRPLAGWTLVRSCSKDVFSGQPGASSKTGVEAGLLAIVIAAFFVIGVYGLDILRARPGSKSEPVKTAMTAPPAVEKTAPTPSPMEKPPEPAAQTTTATTAGVNIDSPLPPEKPQAQAETTPTPATKPVVAVEKSSVQAETIPAKTAAPKPTANAPENAQVQAETTITRQSVKKRPAPVSEKPPVQAETAPAPLPENLPDTLGQIMIMEGDNLWTARKDVYGYTGAEQLMALTNANPNVKDLNKVLVGEKITFPAIPLAFHPRQFDRYWVSLAKTSSLQEAYNLVKSYPRFYLRILSYWNEGEGLVFAVLLNYTFSDEASATAWKEQLPSESFSGASVLNKWDKGTVFFSIKP